MVSVNARLRVSECTGVEPTPEKIENETVCPYPGVHGPYFSVEFTKVFEGFSNPYAPRDKPFRVRVVLGKRYPAVRARVSLPGEHEFLPWILVYVPAYFDESVQKWLGCHEAFLREGVIIHEAGRNAENR